MMGFVEGKCLQTVVGIVHGLELSHWHPLLLQTSAGHASPPWNLSWFGQGASFHGLLRGLE